MRIAVLGTGTVGRTLAGADHLAGKVLLDVANPLDASWGVPPSLFVKDTDSLGEQIQRAFDHTTFVSGDDDAAKKSVTALLESLGHTDVIDLGDITTARGAEMLLPLWLRLYAAQGTPLLNVKIVR